jgi:hypothetical protein
MWAELYQTRIEPESPTLRVLRPNGRGTEKHGGAGRSDD